jgi:hypothetical protein
MYFDGSFSYEGARARVLIVSLSDEKLKYVMQMDFGSCWGYAKWVYP